MELRDVLEKKIINALSKAREPLTFEELYNAIAGHVELKSKYMLRRVLANLIKRGKVVRVPLYDRRRMGFRLAEGSEED